VNAGADDGHEDRKYGFFPQRSEAAAGWIDERKSIQLRGMKKKKANLAEQIDTASEVHKGSVVCEALEDHQVAARGRA